MAPKKTTTTTGNNNHEQRPEGLTAEWAELRTTLLAMQEHIQATIHASINEMGEMLLNRLDNRHRRRDHENPFACLDGETEDEEDPDHRRVHRPGRNTNNNHGDDRDNRWEYSFKVDIPEFHGGVRGDELVDWIVSVEEVLDFKQVPDDRRVPLVAMRFRGHTASWWKQFKSTCTRTGKEPVKSWEKLKKHLRHTFLPHNYDRTMYNRLQNLKQGNRSVDEYATEFSQLLTRNELYDSQIQLVSRFIGGLRPQLKSALAQFDPGTVSEAQRRVATFEQQQRSSSWTTSSSRSRPPESTLSPAAGASRDTSDPTPISLRPPQMPEEAQLRRSTRPNALRCYGCGEAGHRQTACPNQSRRGLLIDDSAPDQLPVYDSQEETEKDMDVFQTSGDTGPLLLTRLLVDSPSTEWIDSMGEPIAESDMTASFFMDRESILVKSPYLCDAAKPQ
ncbi:unnamed protein product [Microthlaspi erraticum]|uniref:CCHC-type domain-containing protein n=1 Tax=Microthlaspi erraticum TaxID=1685480 RepID=A0A6D2KUU3_9BRAS|nr:unnamed protein product [Microthlaspi erraticum]